jgi:hypothetical protein
MHFSWMGERVVDDDMNGRAAPQCIRICEANHTSSKWYYN